jgi:hypothetical protein
LVSEGNGRRGFISSFKHNVHGRGLYLTYLRFLRMCVNVHLESFARFTFVGIHILSLDLAGRIIPAGASLKESRLTSLEIPFPRVPRASAPSFRYAQAGLKPDPPGSTPPGLGRRDAEQHATAAEQIPRKKHLAISHWQLALCLNPKMVPG